MSEPGVPSDHGDRDAVVAYIGVGANLGFSRDAVLNALADLSGLLHTAFVASAGLYRSAPVEAEGPDYINTVAEIDTKLSAHELLAALHAIETRYGRVRTTRNAPRTLDLDLLLYGDGILKTPELTVPHPRIAERAFVLRPLIELAGPIDIPGRGRADLLLERVAAQDVERLQP